MKVLEQRANHRAPDETARPGARRPRRFRLIATIAVVFVAASVTVTGCSTVQPTFARVFSSFSGPPQLDRDGSREFQRFREVYLRYAVDGRAQAQQLRHFSEAFRRVRTDYVRAASDRELIDAAIKGVRGLEKKDGKLPPVEVSEAALDAMMASLDSHSSYLNPQEYKESQVITTGEFGGLGIEINMEGGLIKVISPIDDTPAYRAGIKAGDLITHVDGDSIQGMTIGQAVRRMRGKPRTDIVITIRRQGVKDFNVTITRAIIRTRPVKWRLEGEIGVIRITQFNQRTSGGLDAAIKDLRGKSNNGLKGIVLDLRNNPGGLLTQSVAVADAFLQSGDVVSIRGREGDSRSFNAHQGDIARGLPMVVLINSGSASASEIVAGALQDLGRATVIGVRSFGKGSVQTILPLGWAGALRLTTALYYLPSGRSIQGAGVEPDIIISAKADSRPRREEDQPNALAAVPPVNGKILPKHKVRANFTEGKCPGALNTRTKAKDDRVMGCALMFLRAGSPENFLAQIESRKAL